MTDTLGPQSTPGGIQPQRQQAKAITPVKPEQAVQSAQDHTPRRSAPVSKSDPVNHPAHYTSHPKGIECIEVIEDAPLFNLGQAVKYIWRVLWGSKEDDIQDLEKAVWYLSRQISIFKHERDRGAN